MNREAHQYEVVLAHAAGVDTIEVWARNRAAAITLAQRLCSFSNVKVQRVRKAGTVAK